MIHIRCFRAGMLLLLLASPFSFSKDVTHTARLIIGFHSESFDELGGPEKAIEYINLLCGHRQVSLIRVIDKASILIDIDHPEPAHIRKFINKLLMSEKIRYVNPDRSMHHLPAKGSHPHNQSVQ